MYFDECFISYGPSLQDQWANRLRSTARGPGMSRPDMSSGLWLWVHAGVIHPLSLVRVSQPMRWCHLSQGSDMPDGGGELWGWVLPPCACMWVCIEFIHLMTLYALSSSYPSIFWLVGSFPSGIVASHSFHCWIVSHWNWEQVFVAFLWHSDWDSEILWWIFSLIFYCYQYLVCHVTLSPRAHITVPCHITPLSIIWNLSFTLSEMGKCSVCKGDSFLGEKAVYCNSSSLFLLVHWGSALCVWGCEQQSSMSLCHWGIRAVITLPSSSCWPV